MAREDSGLGRRDFLATVGRGGLAASLMGGGVLGPWGAANVALAQAALPGPLRIHGNPVATRDKDMKPFKEANNVDLQIQLSVTHTETVSRIYAGATKQFDLFTLQHPFIKKLAKDRMILPIEESKIPNIDNLYDHVRRPEWAVHEGRLYALNYLWGYDSVVYNQARIPKVDSWGVLFEDTHKGRVAWRDDPLQMILTAALYMQKFRDPNNLSEPELTEVKKFLIARKKNIRTMWTTYAEAVNLLRSEEVYALWGWLPMATSLRKDGMQMSYALPKEKPIMWFTNYIVSKDSQVLPTVWAFLNYNLGDPFTLSMTNDFDYRMGSSRQLKLLPPERLKQIGLDNIPELVRNSFTYLLPDRLDKYVEAWAEVKAS
ncbi:MAG TPA: extracellular solute-binding protein [Methylomirabilota bacterium]|jgi:spermidine/putrescine transport system substrate-binding protein|nr:extracellular solute-binding protein [Methylomirabilota bacterium]